MFTWTGGEVYGGTMSNEPGTIVAETAATVIFAAGSVSRGFEPTEHEYDYKNSQEDDDGDDGDDNDDD